MSRLANSSTTGQLCSIFDGSAYFAAKVVAFSKTGDDSDQQQNEENPDSDGHREPAPLRGCHREGFTAFINTGAAVAANNGFVLQFASTMTAKHGRSSSSVDRVPMAESIAQAAGGFHSSID